MKYVAQADEFIRAIFPLNPLITRRIVMITASGKIPFKFSWSKLLNWHRENGDKSNFRYEGELFPAMYWVREPETVYFFPSGSVVLTGAKSLSRVEHVLREFIHELKKLRTDLCQNTKPEDA